MVWRSRKSLWLALLMAGGILSATVGAARATESAKQIYLLGYRSSLAGVMPPPGVYVQSDKFLYEADASPSLDIEIDGRIFVDVKAEIKLEVPTFIWITKQQILGGSLGFFAITPVGWQKVNVGAQLSGPNGLTIGGKQKKELTSYADPFVLSYLGWHAGNFHWQVGAGTTIPVGDYKKGRIANWGFGDDVWGFDVGAAFTWFDQQRGLELTVSPGVTFRTENTATNYKSGDELHVEWAAMKHLATGQSLGLVGYHFEQLTGDSGSGALLGDFKGRATALGAQVGFNFNLAGRQASLKLKGFQEFNVRNRLTARHGWLTFAIPLSQPRTK